jgi:enterochelin esterase family protein
MNIQTGHPATTGPAHPAVAPLLAAGTPSQAAVDALLSEHSFPLVEPGAATFVYRGAAERVEVVRFIHANADREPLTRVPGSELWLARLPVPDGARFEYKLAITRGGAETWETDPLNPVHAEDPFGQNSVCRAFGYQRPAWSRPRGAPKGRIVDLAVRSRVFGEVRGERVYLPPGYDPGASYPLIVIHDGYDFVTYADLAVSLDNLIEAGDIAPVIAALVQTRDRMGEYARGRRHARYLVGDLLPALESRFAVSREPQERVLLGASLGAVASLATAFRYPGVFGGLVLKSGSFIFDPRKLERRPHPVFHRIERLVRALHRVGDLPGTRAFISTGEFEGLADENRALASFLRNRGADVLFRAAWDGHHWHNWRDQLRDGLMWVLNPGGMTQG